MVWREEKEEEERSQKTSKYPAKHYGKLHFGFSQFLRALEHEQASSRCRTRLDVLQQNQELLPRTEELRALHGISAKRRASFRRGLGEARAPSKDAWQRLINNQYAQ